MQSVQPKPPTNLPALLILTVSRLFEHERVPTMSKTKASEDFILASARQILLSRIRQPGGILSNVDEVKQYLTMQYALLETEQFGCMFLDRSFALINHLTMFRGTVSACATYPREIAREALLQNACAVVLIHNHPSHNPLPSPDDIAMTKTIQAMLLSLDIHLFDHIIVSGANVYSLRTAGHLE